MKLVKGKQLVTGGVLQKTDKYGKSVEHILESGENGLYLVEKNGDAFSVHTVAIVPEEVVVIKKIEEVVRKTIKPKTIKRSFRKK